MFSPLILLTAIAAMLAHSTQAHALLPRQSSGIYGSNGNTVDTDAGASGGNNGSSFSLSTGGLVAIIIVVVVVVIFGVATTVLFVLAKRRQWTMRETLRRASRRLTSRGGDGSSRRAGIQLENVQKPARVAHKRGLVVEVRDVEKGTQGSKTKEAPKKKGLEERFNEWRSEGRNSLK